MLVLPTLMLFSSVVLALPIIAPDPSKQLAKALPILEP
jgi:hypothetical protein